MEKNCDVILMIYFVGVTKIASLLNFLKVLLRHIKFARLQYWRNYATSNH